MKYHDHDHFVVQYGFRNMLMVHWVIFYLFQWFYIFLFSRKDQKVLHNVYSQQLNKYILARISCWESWKAETTQPKGLCCMDNGSQRIRFFFSTDLHIASFCYGTMFEVIALTHENLCSFCWWVLFFPGKAPHSSKECGGLSLNAWLESKKELWFKSKNI